jgi:hypothetical protein
MSPSGAIGASHLLTPVLVVLLGVSFFVCLALPNSNDVILRYRPKLWHIAPLTGMTAAAFVFAAYVQAPPPFLYFNF